MKRILPLVIAIIVGLGGFLYFNEKTISTSNIESIFIYSQEEYISKKPTPLIKLQDKKPVDTVVNTIVSSQDTNRKVNINEPDYVIDINYTKDEKKVFLLWINENTSSAMFQNKNTLDFYIASKKCTTSLKTLIFR